MFHGILVPSLSAAPPRWALRSQVVWVAVEGVLFVWSHTATLEHVVEAEVLGKEYMLLPLADGGGG